MARTQKTSSTKHRIPMNNRRQFLGSVIGLYAATLLPFVAKANPLPTAIALTKKQRLLAAGHRIFITDSLQTLHKYTFNLLVVENGKVIEIAGPNMKKVEIDKENGNAIFTAEDVNMKMTMTVKGLALLDIDGKKIAEADYRFPVNFVNGDTLKQTYSFNL